VAGDIALVECEVGACKTAFVRGPCRALGVAGAVPSATFTVGQRYAARVPVSHLDLYRIGELSAEDPDLLSDYLGPDRIAFVEWPPEADAVATLARVAARVHIAHAGGELRTVEIE